MVQFRQRAGCGGRPEGRAKTGRTRLEGKVKPKADIVAKDHRSEQRIAAAILCLGDRQRRWDDGAAGMQLAVGIIGLIGVGRHAVGEGGEDRRGSEIGSQHRALFLAALRARVLQPELPRLKSRARNDGGERVENMALAFLNHFSRQFHPPRGEHIVRQESMIFAIEPPGRLRQYGCWKIQTFYPLQSPRISPT